MNFEDNDEFDNKDVSIISQEYDNGVLYNHMEDGSSYVGESYMPTMNNLEMTFKSNLLDFVDMYEVEDIARKLGTSIEDDIASTQEWRDSLAKAIAQFGFNPVELSEPFTKACNIYSTEYITSLLEFIAYVKSEILKPSGPVKIDIIGSTSDEMEERAGRVKDFMNLYLTGILKNFYTVAEQAIIWAWIAGSGFIKTFQDPLSEDVKPICVSIKPNDLIVHQNETDLHTAKRITHKIKISQETFNDYVDAGIYKNVPLTENASSNEDEVDQTLLKVNKLEENTSTEKDEQIYVIYECHVNLKLQSLPELDASGNKIVKSLPYIMILSGSSFKPIGLYRNWEESDPRKERIQYFTQFKYITGFDFYGLGSMDLTQNFAYYSAAVKRIVINNGILSNAPVLLRLDSVTPVENNINLQPGTWTAVGATDNLPLSDMVMPLPFKEISPLLKQIGDEIGQSVSRISGISTLKFDDVNPNMPVGTTVSIIESAQRVQSSILMRLHSGFNELFNLIYKIFAKYLTLDDVYPYIISKEEQILMLPDFQYEYNIRPVSDPNDNSTVMRIMKNESILKTAQTAPEFHNIPVILKNLYRSLGVDNVDDIVIDPAEKQKEIEASIVPLDPISSSIKVMKGEPVKAFMGQAHDQYKMIFDNIATSLDPNNPDDLARLKVFQVLNLEHDYYKYLEEVQNQTGMELPTNPEELDINLQNMIANIAAETIAQNMKEPAPPAPSAEEIMMRELELKEAALRQKAENDQQIHMKEMEIARMRSETELEKARMSAEVNNHKTEVAAKVRLIESHEKENI